MRGTLKDCKIAVIGLGGVGGYLAAMLANTFPHVSAVARGARYDAISANGIVLHSDLNGEICARPETLVHSSSELEEQDCLFISVKNYSLEEAIYDIKAGRAAGPGTVIIPVMNGVDCGDKIREAFPDNTVIDSVIYIVSMAREDYSIEQQGDFADMRIGFKRVRGIGKDGQRSPDDSPVLSADVTDGTAGCVPVSRNSRDTDVPVSDILKTAGIRHKVSKDIEVDIWRKYILNCAYNVATAAWDLPVGGLRSDPAKTADYAELAGEAWRLGCAKGVALKEEHLTAIIDKFGKYADNATSSLQRDIRGGKKSELDTFSGYVVNEGRRLGVPVPVSERYYEMLLQKV